MTDEVDGAIHYRREEDGNVRITGIMVPQSKKVGDGWRSATEEERRYEADKKLIKFLAKHRFIGTDEEDVCIPIDAEMIENLDTNMNHEIGRSWNNLVPDGAAPAVALEIIERSFQKQLRHWKKTEGLQAPKSPKEELYWKQIKRLLTGFD